MFKLKKGQTGRLISYIFLIAFGMVMIYPLLWLFFAAFKTNTEIFGSRKLLPSAFSFESYINGWRGSGRYGFSTFFTNSFKIVLPSLALILISSILVAYGFARFTFPCKKFLFSMMIATLMLPNSVIVIPRYILFRNFGWINTFRPFIIPSAFGSAFFIFLLIQFMRSIPLELDEAAYIDGCGSFHTLVTVLLPLCKPVIFSVIVFHSLWTWNDFFGPLIYLNSVSRYTVSLGLRMGIDTSSAIQWSNVMAMSLLSIIPIVILYFTAQKYFVEGITTTGLKG